MYEQDSLLVCLSFWIELLVCPELDKCSDSRVFIIVLSTAAYFQGASEGGMVHLFVNDCATSGEVIACACV